MSEKSKNQLFTGLFRERGLDQHFSIYKQVKLEDVMKLVDRSDVVGATDGRVTVVQDSPGRNSLDASWHQDGLTYQYPPETVLLYCESAGRCDITTDLADVSSTFEKLDLYNQSMLEKMYRCYVSRSGEQLYKDRIVQKHLDTGERFLNLCSRGWVQGNADMTLEQMVRIMYTLFDSIHPCYVHSWDEGDCLVFNNYKYLHRRHNPSNVPDPDRRLIRMWFTSDLS